MMNIKIVLRFCTLFMVALLATSCSTEKSSIKIGVVLPLTGTFAIYGEQSLRGAQLAVEEINKAGGVLGSDLELVVRDNQTNPAKSVKFSRE